MSPDIQPGHGTPQDPLPKRDSLLMTGDQKVVPLAGGYKGINYSETKPEEEMVTSLIQQASKNIVGASARLDSINERLKWKDLLTGISTAMSEEANVSSEIDAVPVTRRTMAQEVLYRTLKAGTLLNTYASVRRLIEFAERKGIYTSTSGDIELFTFSSVGEASVPLNGVAIYELSDPNILQKRLPSELFGQFTEALKLDQTKDADKAQPAPGHHILEDTESYKLHLMEAASILSGAIFQANGSDYIASSPDLNTVRRRYPGSLRNTARLVSNIETAKNTIRKTILDPNSKDFAALREQFIPFLQGDRNEQLMTMFSTGIQDENVIIDTYRKLTTLLANGADLEFYGQLLGSIKVLIEEGKLGDAIFIPTAEEATEILQNNNGESKTVGLGEVGGVTSSIFKLSSKREFDIDPESVEWEQVVPPTDLSIRLSKNPSIFNATFLWMNEFGERINVSLDIDTKKGLKWYFLEDPSDPTVLDMKDAMTYSVWQSLSKIHQDLTEERQARAQTPNLPLKRERPEVRDEIYDLRKRVAVEDQDSVEVQAVFPSVSDKTTEIKREIILPDEKVLERMLSSLGTENQGRILSAIEEFNTRGVGRFRILRGKGSDGQPLYRLTEGDVRVLAHEIETSKGLRRFAILDIKDRKDIYRNKARR